METIYTSIDNHEDDDMNNIILMNSIDSDDDDAEDYDFDYDPNDMYYELSGR